jgi:hypothetical protein
MMALAQAEMAEISDSMTLSEDSNDLSWVSQNVFPGPVSLIPQRPQNPSVFPEGHHRGHVAGRWLGFPAAAACMLPAEF